MEGLIPVVFKSLKKKNIRRRYECLSSGAPQPYNYNMGDNDHEHDHGHDHHGHLSRSRDHQDLIEAGCVGGAHHRRCNSLGGSHTAMAAAYKPKQLVRNRLFVAALYNGWPEDKKRHILSDFIEDHLSHSLRHVIRIAPSIAFSSAT